MTVTERRADTSRPRQHAGRDASALLERLFWVPSSARNLAVLRIVVFATLGIQVLSSRAVEFSRLPDVLVDEPRLTGILVALPRGPLLVAIASWLLVAACLLAVVGWRTRYATVTTAALSLYVLGIPQLYGKVDHYHHLVWLAVLLACSPCFDALALDRRSQRQDARAVAYGFPLRVAWLLIGACYFFPGLAKLEELDIWLSPGNLRGLLRLQQWAAGAGTAVPEWLLTPAAIATLVFELGFVFAVFNRRLRPWALVAGVAFHATTYVTMRISFWSLVVCYVAFIDWSRALRRPERDVDRTPSRGVEVAAATLVLGVFVTGVTFVVAAWPFASYPTFSGDFRGSDRATTAEIVAIDEGGRSRIVDVFDWVPASRRAAVTWNAIEHPRVLANLGRDAVPSAERLRVFEVTESTRRDDRGRALGRVLLLDVEL